jgi:plasmid replication initiation protein
LEGAFSIEINSFSENGIYLVGIKDIFANSFKRKDIKRFNNIYYKSWYEVWWFYHEKGLLPYNKGWYEHAQKILQVIEIFEGIYKAYKNDREKKALDNSVN